MVRGAQVVKWEGQVKEGLAQRAPLAAAVSEAHLVFQSITEKVWLSPRRVQLMQAAG